MTSSSPSLAAAVPFAGSRWGHALIGGTAVLVLAFLLYALFSPGSFNYVEGDVATWILLWRHGHAADLYRAPAQLPMYSSNYPPLYLWLVASLSPSDEAIVVTGRLVSLCGLLLAIATLSHMSIRALKHRSAGVLVAMWMLATVRISLHGVMCYPDALALGLGCIGVTIVALRTPGWPILAALLMVASVLTKHSLIVFPIAIAIWSLWREPKKGSLFCALSAGLLLLALRHWQLFDALLSRTMAPWHWNTFARHSLYYVAASLPLLGVGVLVLRRLRSLPTSTQRAIEPWAFVFGIGLGWLLALGRTGASYNYMLELMTSGVLLLTVSIYSNFGWRLQIFATVVTAIEALSWTYALSLRVLPSSAADVKAAQAELKALSADALILAEPTWYSLVANRLPMMIPFLGTQMAGRGLWNPQVVADQLHRQAVPRVLLYLSLDNPELNERFPSEICKELRDHYTLLYKLQQLHVYGPKDVAVQVHTNK